MLFRGDNTAAFGNNLLTIRLNNDTGYRVTKAVLRVGVITKKWDNPTFPMIINLTEAETAQLQSVNQAYLACWDEDGRKQTCEGTITITSRPRRV